MPSSPIWFDSLGREVDLDNIDKEYALAILTMVLLRRGRRGATDVRHDPLIDKLRDVVLNGRAPNEADLARARAYNEKNKAAGLPYRATAVCPKCNDTGMIPDPDRGSGDGPYWDTRCDCGAAL